MSGTVQNIALKKTYNTCISSEIHFAKIRDATSKNFSGDRNNNV